MQNSNQVTSEESRPHIQWVCSNCGSTNVVLNAEVDWNFDKQRWEVANVLDDGQCKDCQSTVINSVQADSGRITDNA